MLRAPVGGSFERQLPEPGMMRARYVAVYDLGTHIDTKFTDDKGRPKKNHLIQVQWELDQMMEYEGEQKPMMATKRYTLSAHKKSNLRKDLESHYGKAFNDDDLEKAGGFDVSKLLGRPCLLNIAHSPDGKYANVIGVNPPMKGDAGAAAQFYPSRFFELSNPNPDVWATMSQKTREYIAQSEEVKSGQVKLPSLTITPAPESTSDANEDAPY